MKTGNDVGAYMKNRLQNRIALRNGAPGKGHLRAATQLNEQACDMLIVVCLVLGLPIAKPADAEVLISGNCSLRNRSKPARGSLWTPRTRLDCHPLRVSAALADGFRVRPARRMGES